MKDYGDLSSIKWPIIIGPIGPIQTQENSTKVGIIMQAWLKIHLCYLQIPIAPLCIVTHYLTVTIPRCINYHDLWAIQWLP